MKTLLKFATALLLFAAALPHPAAAAEDRIAEEAATVEAFYVAYCRQTADGGDPSTLFDRFLTDRLANKVKTIWEKSGYDPIVRAQDFDLKDLETLTVTHVDGAWYAVTYLAGYTHRCVVIPVRVRTVDGRTRLDDITVE